MDQALFNKDIIVMQTDAHGDIFNMQKTIDHPDFHNYFKLREKLPDKSPADYNKRYGVDLTGHFEIAYQALKILEESDKFEVYDEDDENPKHPFDAPDEEL